MNGALANPLLDALMLAMSSRWLWFGVAAIFLTFAAIKRRVDLFRIALVIGVTIGIADFVTYQVLKSAVERLRPCHALANVRLVPASCSTDFSFPSNHAVNSMAAAVVIAGFLPRRQRPFAYAAALLVAFSRVYLGVHYPFDVLCGLVVGALFGTVARYAYRSPDRSKTTLGLRDTTPSTLE